jgi:hypothetical protein
VAADRNIRAITNHPYGFVVNVDSIVERTGGKVRFKAHYVPIITCNVEAWDEKG